MAWKFLARFRGLATTAAAVILNLQCGHSVIDPAPPPPQQCSTRADPFADITLRAYLDYTGVDGGAPPVVVEIFNVQTIGIGVAVLLVTANGTLVSLGDLSGSAAFGDDSFVAKIMLSPPSSGDTTYDLQFEIDFTCGDTAASRRYHIPISAPLMGGQSLSVLPI